MILTVSHHDDKGKAMRRPVTVHVESVFDVGADEVWDRFRRIETMVYLLRGLLGVPALKGARIEAAEGQVASPWILLFHVIPLHRHTIEVVEVDAGSRTIRTHEHGGLIRRWDHTLHAEALPGGRCRYADTVIIDAGWATPVVAAFAKIAYRYRHRRWPELLRRQAPGGATRPSGENSTDAVPPSTQ